MKKTTLWAVIIIFIAILGVVLWGPIVSNVEQAQYTVVETHDNIEIRDYAPVIVAQVEVSGDRKEAINRGFRIIADYIFGNNVSAQNVKMTAPVTQQKSEKIAMTAPVTQTADGNLWIVRFVMPARFTMQTLPKPTNQAVKLQEIPSRRYAVIRFSGIAGAENLKTHTAQLESFIKAHHLKAIAPQPTYAFFNPPWTLPFLRRNEVMIEVQ